MPKPWKPVQMAAKRSWGILLQLEGDLWGYCMWLAFLAFLWILYDSCSFWMLDEDDLREIFDEHISFPTR